MNKGAELAIDTRVIIKLLRVTGFEKESIAVGEAADFCLSAEIGIHKAGFSHL